MEQHSARGQSLADEFPIYQFRDKAKRSCTDEWTEFLVAAGVWVNDRDKLMPHMMFQIRDVLMLESEFKNNQDFGEQIAVVAEKFFAGRGASRSKSAVGDLA